MTDKNDEAVLLGVTRRVVDQFTVQGLLFTALDVSNAVKQSLAHIRHRQVAPIVRQLFDDEAMGEDYEQTLIDVMAKGDKPAQAYLYHLESDSTDDYDDERRKQLAIPPVSTSASDDTVLDAGISEVELELGLDGRLRVPKQLLERAGVKTEEVQVLQSSSGPTLTLREPAAGAPGTVADLTYNHPSHLHIPSRLAYAFDPDGKIVARAEPSDSCVQVDGPPRPD